MNEDFPWKYNEGPVLDELKEYISSTYGEHYAHDVDDKGMQLFDLWQGMGVLAPTAQATALKYITRYGRKGGYNKKDIFKAIHYCLLLLHDTQTEPDSGRANDDFEKMFSPKPSIIPAGTGVDGVISQSRFGAKYSG